MIELMEPTEIIDVMVDENGMPTNGGGALLVDDVNIFAPPPAIKPIEEAASTTIGNILVSVGNVLNGTRPLPTIKTPEQIEAERLAELEQAKRKRFGFIAATLLAIAILAFVSFSKNK